MENIGRIFMLIGILFLVFGMLWYFGGKFLPLGKLPGDFSSEYSNVKFYFPLTSSIILSLILTIVLWLLFSFIK